MKSANELAIASKLASQVYRTIDKDVRHVNLYRKLTGMAKLLVKKNVSKEDIKRELDLYVANAIALPFKKPQLNKPTELLKIKYKSPNLFNIYTQYRHKALSFMIMENGMRKIRGHLQKLPAVYS